jgi:hypothetical protein
LTFFLSLRLVSKDFKSYAESRLLEVIKMHYDGRKLKSDLGSLLSILGKTGLDSTITIKVLILENLSPQTDTKIESLGELWKDGQLEELEYRSKIKNRKREYIEEGDLKSFSWFTAFLGSSESSERFTSDASVPSQLNLPSSRYYTTSPSERSDPRLSRLRFSCSREPQFQRCSFTSRAQLPLQATSSPPLHYDVQQRCLLLPRSSST